MKTKYNWAEIQIDFLTSDIHEVKEFFEKRYSTYTGHIKSKTKGWTEKKKKIINDAKLKAEAEILKELAERYRPSRKELAQMHSALLNTIAAKIFSFNQSIVKDDSGTITFKKNINVRELEVYWRIIRTELGLPIRYSENQNIGSSSKQDLSDCIVMYERV